MGIDHSGSRNTAPRADRCAPFLSIPSKLICTCEDSIGTFWDYQRQSFPLSHEEKPLRRPYNSQKFPQIILPFHSHLIRIFTGDAAIHCAYVIVEIGHMPLSYHRAFSYTQDIRRILQFMNDTRREKDSMPRSHQDGRTQTISVWQHILRYLQGMLVGASSLLLFALLLLIFFLIYPLQGFREMAVSMYSSISGACVLLWIVSLVLGVRSWKERRTFSLGIFTMLALVLLISPGLVMGWLMGAPR
jgi:hypothetical protein